MFEWLKALGGSGQAAAQEWPGMANIPTSAGNSISNIPQPGYLQQLGGYVENNPNQTAIMLDMLGSRLDPENAFAGIGQYMGKSNIASDATSQQQQQQQAFLSQLLSALSGKQSPGPTSFNVTMGDDGTPTYNIKGTGLGEMNTSLTPQSVDPTQQAKPLQNSITKDPYELPY